MRDGGSTVAALRGGAVGLDGQPVSASAAHPKIHRHLCPTPCRRTAMLPSSVWKAALRMLPMQPGDVAATYADTTALARDTGYTPGTSIEVGVARFVAWYREFYRV